MTRIFVVIVLFLFCFNAYATTVCARDDIVTIGLAEVTNPTSVVYDNDAFEWRVYYNGFGTVTGISSCAPFGVDTVLCPNGNQPVFKQYSGCPYAQSGADVNTNFQGRNDGNLCWCKIIHPFESKWVNIWIYTASCTESCAQYCARSGMMGNHGAFRSSIMATVGMDD